MMEFVGIIALFLSLVDLYLKGGNAMNYFLVGMILIIGSMIIKSHSEIVQIRKYIGDYKRTNNQEKVDYKEDLDALNEKVEED
jgi:hypothetical protein